MKQEVLELDYKEMQQEGIKTLIFDYDGTLGKRFSLPDKELVVFLKKLQKTFTIYIFSNNLFLAKKRKAIFKEHDITYVQTVKPLYFEKNYIKRDDKQAIIIGDTFYTDCLYGMNIGIPCILVK